MDIFFCLGHLPPFHPLQSLWIIPRNGPSTYPDSLACPVAAAPTLCFLWALCRLSSHPPLPLPIKIFIHLSLDDPISQVSSISQSFFFISCFIFGHQPCHIYVYIYTFPFLKHPTQWLPHPCTLPQSLLVIPSTTSSRSQTMCIHLQLV